jgi:flagellar assembly protein FliH
MLAKLIRRASEPFALVEWPPARPASEEPSGAASAADGHSAELVKQLRAETAMLMAELELARADGERRVQEALATARRDADESSRQMLEKQLEGELSKLRNMMRDLTSSGAKLRRNAEEELVRLSIAVARRILHRELTIDPDALAGLVKAAFERLDQREIHEVRTDPGSLTTVRKLAEGLDLARAVKIVADPALRPGSLLIETTRGQLDASIETQLNEIQRGFVDIVQHA